MGRTKEFLNTLSDHELAFFSKYKLHTYMRNTQQDIRTYIEERNLNEKKISQLITKPTKLYYKKAKCCPRCGTDKLLINNVEWTETSGKVGYEDEIVVGNALMGKTTYKDEIICNVCNFWIQDPNNKKPRENKKNKWSIWNFIDFILDL